jgi:hypothetical protein
MKRQPPAPRSLHEWMDRNQMTAKGLAQLVRKETGRSISETMMSFILRGSRRCSNMNALALHTVTKVPMKTLMRWPASSGHDNVSGEHQNPAA